MTDSATKLLEDRITAIIERVKALGGERDALRGEIAGLRRQLDEMERMAKAARDQDVLRLERENARLRSALEGAIRELREEA